MRDNLEMVGEKFQEEFCLKCKPVVILEGDLNEKGTRKKWYDEETGKEGNVGR